MFAENFVLIGSSILRREFWPTDAPVSERTVEHSLSLVIQVLAENVKVFCAVRHNHGQMYTDVFARVSATYNKRRSSARCASPWGRVSLINFSAVLFLQSVQSLESVYQPC